MEQIPSSQDSALAPLRKETALRIPDNIQPVIWQGKIGASLLDNSQPDFYER